MRRFLAPLALATATLIAVPTIAVAGVEEQPPEFRLEIELLSTTEPLTFGLVIVDADCDEGTFEVVSVETGEYEPVSTTAVVTPISVTEDPTDPNAAVMVLPSDTTPGALLVEVACEDGETDVDASEDFLWASIPVTKVVSGTAPAGATFTVNLDCLSERDDEIEAPGGAGFGPQDLPEDFEVDLTFPAAGGTKYVYTDHGGVCTVTEPVNGGATSVQITPASVDTRPAPDRYPVTVTNTFATVVQPTFTG